MTKGRKERKKSLTLALLQFFIIVLASRTRATRSLGQKTSWMFSTVLHLLLYSLTVKFLHHFFIMPVGFNWKFTYGLKPQVSSIKIVTVYRRSIFQVESHYTTRTAPRLVCSTKLIPFQRSSYLDGWPNMNTPCWINFFFSSFPFEGDI